MASSMGPELSKEGTQNPPFYDLTLSKVCSAPFPYDGVLLTSVPWIDAKTNKLVGEVVSLKFGAAIFDVDETIIEGSAINLHDGVRGRFSRAAHQFMDALFDNLDEKGQIAVASFRDQPLEEEAVLVWNAISGLIQEDNLINSPKKLKDLLGCFSSLGSELSIDDLKKALIVSEESDFATQLSRVLLEAYSKEESQLRRRDLRTLVSLISKESNVWEGVSWKHIWKRLGRHAGKKSEEICSLISKDIGEIFGIEVDPSKLEELSRVIVQRDYESFKKKINIVPHLMDLIGAIKKADIPLTICSASPKEVIKTPLKENGVWQQCKPGTTVTSACKKTASGYSGESITKACENLGVDPSVTVMFGDSTSDYFSAFLAGVRNFVIRIPTPITGGRSDGYVDDYVHNFIFEKINEFSEIFDAWLSLTKSELETGLTLEDERNKLLGNTGMLMFVHDYRQVHIVGDAKRVEASLTHMVLEDDRNS